jgi:hypothetical protein
MVEISVNLGESQPVRNVLADFGVEATSQLRTDQIPEFTAALDAL